jgi:hypothetical protein
VGKPDFVENMTAESNGRHRHEVDFEFDCQHDGSGWAGSCNRRWTARSGTGGAPVFGDEPESGELTDEIPNRGSIETGLLCQL